MNTDEIKEMVAKAQIEQAISSVIELTKEDDLNQLSIEISSSYRVYKRNIIAGILNNEQQRQETAIITNKIMNLVREFEISQIKILKNNLKELKEVIKQSDQHDSIGLVNEIDEIEKDLGKYGDNKSKDELHPSILHRIKSFYERLNNPDSKERKLISNVNNAVQFVSKIISIVKLVPF
jgi:hypothetical protein